PRINSVAPTPSIRCSPYKKARQVAQPGLYSGTERGRPRLLDAVAALGRHRVGAGAAARAAADDRGLDAEVVGELASVRELREDVPLLLAPVDAQQAIQLIARVADQRTDRKSTRLNSSHVT